MYMQLSNPIFQNEFVGVILFLQVTTLSARADGAPRLDRCSPTVLSLPTGLSSS